MTDWLSSSWTRFEHISGERVSVIDMHTAGEPLRIILAAPWLPAGEDVLARRREAAGAWDRYRRLLMFEPRGHADMYGALIVPPVTPGALFGVLFTHNEGYSTMCGHAIIALAKAAVELGWRPPVEPVTTLAIDTPAGLVTAHARVSQGRVVSTFFENVPSFVERAGLAVAVAGLGEMCADLAFGGAYYAYVDAETLGLDLTLDNGRRIIEAGMAIKEAVAAAHALSHPEAEDLGFLYGTIFTGPARSNGAHSRHACVFADGALDRSPTGTGVAGRVALLHVRGELAIGQAARFESLTGQAFQGRAVRALDHHGRRAVIPQIEGEAYFTGRSEFVLEPDDPLAEGFLIR